ncbi:MAG TPA: EpsI family protein [Phenylobacterium sp.]|uniref:exosortase-associated protein EpsI, V-type n=1 Tax=Phenylobacterium sp. TaxID=1871053 RepID=UPI002D3BA37E|nr:exosortase-associated protein EpsI, V-type [Phenylobacterium sp.]HZZ69123.1 EpsI family protein [Phenylobacterium sp.]
MIPRRSLIIAGLSVVAAGAAEALIPRHRLILLKSGTVASSVPTQFGAWQAEASPGLVSPDQAGALARSLYSEIIERTYQDANSGASVMFLAAYGDTQSDLLQLHRPEACYPAVGFTIRSTVPAMMSLPGGARLPARKVVAVAGERVENIVYWTRIGEALPQSSNQQRSARLAEAMHGDVADGILMRCSIIGDPEQSFQQLDAFVPALLNAVAPAERPALIGTGLAKQMTV